MNTMNELTKRAIDEQDKNGANINGSKSCCAVFDSQGNVNLKGLTKREHFAALAMQGILSADTRRVYEAERVAADAVRYADSLLKGLQK